MFQAPPVLFDVHIRNTWHRVYRMYNQKAAEHDMTISIGFILMNVDREGTPSTQLGPRMGMEPTSLSRTLKTMEEKGLIRRQEDSIDKRKVLIFLTEDGVAKRREVRNFLYEFNSKVYGKIAPTKMKAFVEVMQKINVAIEEEIKEVSKANSLK